MVGPRDEEKSGVYQRLRADVDKARAEAELIDLANISKAGATDWRASAWKLSRLYAERYSEKHVVANINVDDVEDGRDTFARMSDAYGFGAELDDDMKTPASSEEHQPPVFED